MRARPGHGQEGPRDQRGPLLPDHRTGPFSIFLHIYGMPGLFFLSPSFGWCHAACENSVPRPGTEPRPSGMEVWSPNHWTAGDFLFHVLTMLFASCVSVLLPQLGSVCLALDTAPSGHLGSTSQWGVVFVMT